MPSYLQPSSRYIFELVLFVLFVAITFIYTAYKVRVEEQRKLERAKIESDRHQLELMRGMLMQRFDFVHLLEDIQNATRINYKMQDEDWKNLEIFLDGTQGLFVYRLREQFPNLTEEDLRMLMLLRLKSPAKVLAHLYGIAEKSVKQNLFLFKKKIGIDKAKESLRSFIEQY